MADAPNGHQVASQNVQGAGSFLDIIKHGVRGAIDLELAGRQAAVSDRAEVSAATQANEPQATPLADTLRALTPLQLGGLVLAGVLTVALLSGQFR